MEESAKTIVSFLLETDQKIEDWLESKGFSKWAGRDDIFVFRRPGERPFFVNLMYAAPNWLISHAVGTGAIERIVTPEKGVNIINSLVPPVSESVDRACSQCEIEFGVHNPEASHSLCKRHMLDAYRQIKPTPVEAMERVKQRPDSTFPPDLARVPAEQRGRPFDFVTKQFVRT